MYAGSSTEAGLQVEQPDREKVRANVALWSQATSTWRACVSAGQAHVPTPQGPDTVIKEAETTDIGRSTIYGNPVRIGFTCPICHQVHRDAGSTIGCYRRYLYARLSDDPKLNAWGERVARSVGYMPVGPGFKEEVKGLQGKTLFCPGCGVNSPTCHGRVLERAVAWLNREGA